MMETRSHTVTWEILDGRSAPANLSGLDAIRRSLETGGQRSPIAALMNFRLRSGDPGVAVLEGVPGEQHYNPLGIVHGGFAATLLDAALWTAVQTTMEPGAVHTTLELKVNYARPITAAVGPLTCEAKVVHRGGRTAIAEARLTGPGEKLYAYGTSTLMILTR